MKVGSEAERPGRTVAVGLRCDLGVSHQCSRADSRLLRWVSTGRKRSQSLPHVRCRKLLGSSTNAERFSFRYTATSSNASEAVCNIKRDLIAAVTPPSAGATGAAGAGGKRRPEAADQRAVPAVDIRSSFPKVGS